MAGDVVEQRTEEGGTIELHRRGVDFEVVVEGRPVFASDTPRGERMLAELALAPWKGRDDITVLVAGLGSGRLVRAFLESPAVARVDVVEVSQAVIDWEAKYFAPSPDKGVAADPRVHVHHRDLKSFLERPTGGVDGGWMIFAVDIDELPYAFSHPDNAALYDEAGLNLLIGALRGGGVLAMALTEKDEDLYKRLFARLQNVNRVGIPVEIRGHSNLDYVYRGRRPPLARSGGGVMN